MICHSPITIKPKFYDKVGLLGLDHTHRTYSAPCGVCPNCKQNRIAEWTFRLREEQKISTSCHFITLTYESQNMDYVYVPYFNRHMGTLSTSHLKNFWKHLRQLENRLSDKEGRTKLEYRKARKTKKNPRPKIKTIKVYEKIKYYAAGEYGTTSTMRPHYHAIIFNVTDTNNYWKAWSKGIVDISEKQVEPGAMAYVAKYIDKPKHIHSDDPRQKEFSRMSQRLGANYLTPEITLYHKNNTLERNFVSHSDGVKQKMPNYYRKQIFSNVERHKQNLLTEKITEDTRNDMSLLAAEQGQSIEEYEMAQKLGKLTAFNHLIKKRT